MGNHTSTSRRSASRGKSGYHKTATEVPNFHQGATAGGGGGSLTIDPRAHAVLTEDLGGLFSHSGEPGDTPLNEAVVAQLGGGGAPGVSTTANWVYNSEPFRGEYTGAVEFETLGTPIPGSQGEHTVALYSVLSPVEHSVMPSYAHEDGTTFDFQVQTAAWGGHVREGLAAFSRMAYIAEQYGIETIHVSPGEETVDLWHALGYEGSAEGMPDTFDASRPGTEDMQLLYGALEEHGLPWPPAGAAG